MKDLKNKELTSLQYSKRPKKRADMSDTWMVLAPCENNNSINQLHNHQQAAETWIVSSKIIPKKENTYQATEKSSSSFLSNNTSNDHRYRLLYATLLPCLHKIKL